MSHGPTITRRQLLGLSTAEEQKQDDNERPLIYFTAEDGDIVFEDTTADVPYSRSSDQVKQSDDVFTRT